MNAPSQDIKDMLEAEGSLNLTYRTNLFIGRETSSPINQVVIIDSFGYNSAVTLKDQSYERPTIDIRIRNKSYTEAMELALRIKDYLFSCSQQTWNGTLYTIIYCSSGPALLEWDENGNSNIIIKFNINRR